MIIHDFNILGVPHHPAKADAPLVVDSYTHLACSLSFQQFEAISRRVTQVLDRRSGIQLAQLAKRPHCILLGNLRLDCPWEVVDCCHQILAAKSAA